MSELLNENAPGGSSACRNLFGYLLSLNSEMRDQLYGCPEICLAVHRELDMESQHYVTRMLFVVTPILKCELTLWVGPQIVNVDPDKVRQLTDLEIFRYAPGHYEHIELNPKFGRSLKVAAWFPSESTRYVLKKLVSNTPVDGTLLTLLGKYAMWRWLDIVHYTFNSAEATLVSPRTIRTLLHGNLINATAVNEYAITRGGFQFLFSDMEAQIWIFLKAYLNSSVKTELSLPECLSLLLQLGTAETGRAYSTRGMTPEMRTFLRDMSDFGFIYQVEPEDDHFFPTLLIEYILTRAKSHVPLEKDQECNIIVNSNHRFSLFTKSNLHIGIVALFAQLTSRSSGVIFGELTRESVRRALDRGIRAHQIIWYLERHAHPQLGTPSLPTEIKKSLKLWDSEMRYERTEGTLFRNFDSELVYLAVRDYAISIGALLMQNDLIPALIIDSRNTSDVALFMVDFQEQINRRP